MKGYLFASIIVLGSMAVHNNANALSLIGGDQTCKKLGYTPGDDCPNDGNSFDAMLISKCMADRPNQPCIIVSCNGQCYCNTTNDCDTGGGEIIQPTVKKCVGTPNWNGGTAPKETGSCSASDGTTLTVYRCKDGFSTGDIISLGGLDDYSTTDITCTACPQHPDDVDLVLTGSKPSYVSTNGAGNKNSSSCRILANTEIRGETGKFVFESDCTYSNISIAQ